MSSYQSKWDIFHTINYQSYWIFMGQLIINQNGHSWSNWLSIKIGYFWTINYKSYFTFLGQLIINPNWTITNQIRAVDRLVYNYIEQASSFCFITADILALAAAINELLTQTRRARTALWCSLQTFMDAVSESSIVVKAGGVDSAVVRFDHTYSDGKLYPQWQQFPQELVVTCGDGGAEF